jgi:hypothetical protein
LKINGGAYLDSLLIYLPVIFIWGIYFLLVGVVFFLKKYHERKKRRSPYTDKFLRSPGESLNRQIMEIDDEIMIYFVWVLTAPIMLYSTYISMLHFRGLQPSLSTIALICILGVGFIIYCFWKLIASLNKRRRYRLGYEGETAVGQELNQLMLDGYRVYHDFPAGKFNIDHIVVGPSGVFAVETKARSKTISANSTPDYMVKYDGKRLQFPNGTDVQAIEQAKRQAKSLSKWLQSATGERVSVRPVLVLPGWFVERTASGGIPVINPKKFRSIAKPIDGNILSESMISRIVHQLEQKCRDVEPKAIEKSLKKT